MSETGTNTAIIIVAGGSGSRMGAALAKQFLPLAGRPVLMHTVERFHHVLPDARRVVVLPGGEIPHWEALCGEHGFSVPHRVVAGGATRAESVRNGLTVVDDAEYILIHDGVRPLVSEGVIRRVLDTAVRYGTAVPVVEPADSFRAVAGEGTTPEAGGSVPVDRTRLRAVQTPQGYSAAVLRRAYADHFDPAAADDAALVERSGAAISLCEGDPRNLKITRESDLVCAEAWLKDC